MLKFSCLIFLNKLNYIVLFFYVFLKQIEYFFRSVIIFEILVNMYNNFTKIFFEYFVDIHTFTFKYLFLFILNVYLTTEVELSILQIFCNVLKHCRNNLFKKNLIKVSQSI